MITSRIVVFLGVAQLICWGTTYYLIGGFGGMIAQETGWSRDVVYGGYSAALLVMGLVSPLTGRLIDAYGGRSVMVAGSLLSAIGCTGVALSHSLALYFASWLCLGLAMRFTLYDAAFAALARIGGPYAKGPMSQITLFGGLASTIFWPLGHALASQLGWRGALLCYAGFALLTIPLHLSIPRSRYEDALDTPEPVSEEPRSEPARAGGRLAAGVLYAVIMTAANFLNSGMSAHMINILAGIGLATSLAVWVATLRGIGQSLARLCEVLFGRRLDALRLNLLATGLLPLAFVAGLLGGVSLSAAVAFAFVYGAGNGLVTITRGTLPLVLFDRRAYGSVVGRLLVPSFILAAAAPIVYAGIIDRFGEKGALLLSAALALIAFGAAVALFARFRPR